MFNKWFKRVLVVGAVSLVLGTFVFGKDVVSYVRSSVKWTRDVAKDSVPIEFELLRARDMIDNILPEIHANIQMIAQEEVEVASLKKDVADSEEAFGQEQSRIERLRNLLKNESDTYEIGGIKYSRSQVTEELTNRFERFKEAELVIESKKRLLKNRQESLASAMQLLEKTKSQKRLLAAKIEGLQSQHRLIKASSVGTGVTVDNSKIAQTEKLIGNIRKRIEVAERVLAHEGKFVQKMQIEEISEQEIVEQVDEYFTDQEETSVEGEINL